MNFKPDEASTLAGFLLQIKAVKLSPANPFTWASGLKSPIYCDNRITLSYPKIRTHIRQQFVQAIFEKYDTPDLIVGVATGGIAQGALIAQELGLPFAYVRTEKKSHGLNNQIEGVTEKGQSAVVIEDLVSTGGSSLKAVEALREKGIEVKGMMAIFTYGLQKALDNFKAFNCNLTTLTDFESLIHKASEENYITENDLQSLLQWRMDPELWSNQRQNCKDGF
jgi:orotate phosphoribosyltransferase